MISQELYFAERLLESRVKMMLARTNAGREGRPSKVGQRSRRFLGWASFNLMGLGARMVRYGLPARRTRGGQIA